MIVVIIIIIARPGSDLHSATGDVVETRCSRLRFYFEFPESDRHWLRKPGRCERGATLGRGERGASFRLGRFRDSGRARGRPDVVGSSPHPRCLRDNPNNEPIYVYNYIYIYIHIPIHNYV